MQRDREQRAAFVAGLVATQIEFMRYRFEIVVLLVLGEHKNREAFLEGIARRLSVYDFLQRAREFVAQSFRRLKPGINRFVHCPKGLAGHEKISGFAARPIRQHSIREQRIVELLHPALEHGAIFRVARIDIGQIRDEVREKTVAEKFGRDLLETAVRIIKNHRHARDFGSHGEVETVALNFPRPRFQFSGIDLFASNCGPVKGPATLSLRTICRRLHRQRDLDRVRHFRVGFRDRFETNFRRRKLAIATFALKRKTVGAFRVVFLRRAIGYQQFAIRVRDAARGDLFRSAKSSCTTARSSTSSPSRKNRGSAALMSNGFETFTVALASPPNWLPSSVRPRQCDKSLGYRRDKIKDCFPVVVVKLPCQKASVRNSFRTFFTFGTASSPPPPIMKPFSSGFAR